MRQIICDHCGKLLWKDKGYENYDELTKNNCSYACYTLNIGGGVLNRREYTTDFYLCKNCRKELEEWLNIKGGIY